MGSDPSSIDAFGLTGKYNPPLPQPDVPNPMGSADPVNQLGQDKISRVEVVSYPEFKAAVIKEGGRLWNLQLKVLKFAAIFFSSAGQKLEQMKNFRLEQVETFYLQQMEMAKQQKELHLEYARGDLKATGEGTKIPVELAKDGASMIHARSHGSKAAAMMVVGKGELPKVADLRAPGFNNPLQPFSFVPAENSPIGKGYISPTSHRREHLVNAYLLVVDGRDYGMIRTGVIKTKQHAEDIAALLNHLISELPEEQRGKPIRIVSQQLNSPENEGHLIEAQHRWIIHANSQLPENATLVHINLPSNRWYYHTQTAEKLGLLGRALTATVFKGERQSHEQNLEAWGTYVDWTREALLDVLDKINVQGNEAGTHVLNYLKIYSADLINKFAELNDGKKILKTAIDDLVVRIHDSQEQLKNPEIDKDTRSRLRDEVKVLSGELKIKRAEMRKHLETEYAMLKRVETEFAKILLSVLPAENPSSDVKALTNVLKAIGLMRQVLGAQLRMPGEEMSRGKEGMLIHLLNDRLGVHSAINCKSGLDRTGFWHAVKLSMVRFENENPTIDAVEFVEGWDDNTTLMNKLEARLNKDGRSLGDWFQPHSPYSYKELVDKCRDLLPKGCATDTIHGNKINFDILIPTLMKLKQVAKFREMVEQNLLATGIPITQISTGFAGLKWNAGMIENLLPLNFLPPSVDGGFGKMARLVDYNSDGSVKGITEYGSAYFTKQQKLRPS